MTDFQFKAIMTLVSETLDKCQTLDDFNNAKTAIAKLGGNLIHPINDVVDKDKKDGM